MTIPKSLRAKFSKLSADEQKVRVELATINAGRLFALSRIVRIRLAEYFLASAAEVENPDTEKDELLEEVRKDAVWPASTFSYPDVILAIMLTRPEETWTVPEVLLTMKQIGMEYSESGVRTAVSRLEDMGTVERASRGEYRLTLRTEADDAR